jgi:hypothetical protein
VKINDKELHRCRACGGIAEWHYPESRRFEFLKLADQVKHLPTDSPFFTAVSDYAVSQSWLPNDVALLSFAALAKAMKGRDMPAIAACLDELCVAVDGDVA